MTSIVLKERVGRLDLTTGILSRAEEGLVAHQIYLEGQQELLGRARVVMLLAALISVYDVGQLDTSK